MGFLKIKYESIVVDYDDEKTPIDLCGKKMLPIMDLGDGKIINESLDIIEAIDKENQIAGIDNLDEVNQLLSNLGANVHSLAMPYFIFTPEFNESSRSYFRNKKESYKGPFKELYQRRKNFNQGLEIDLKKIELELNPFFQSPSLGLKDILLASHLWAMYIVPEFQFSPKVHQYLQEVKSLCHFEYHKESWE